MKYRKLGRTGLITSVVGVGTWQLGGEWGQDFTVKDAESIIDAARECGINFIDTAECYGDHLSESLVGRALKADREKWIVATKFGHKFNAPFTRDISFEPKEVEKQLEGSLRALKTDYIDLYQFHSGADEFFNRQDLWEYLWKLKDKGTIKHLGISIGSNGNIYQTSRATDVHADTIQVVYNRLDRTPEEQVFDSCIDQNLGVLARVPLASGLLSGKYKPGHTFDACDVRGHWNAEGHSKNLIEVEKIANEELPEGVPMACWALAWCLKHPAVTMVIPGCKSASQVKNNALAADLDMVSSDHPQTVKEAGLVEKCG